MEGFSTSVLKSSTASSSSSSSSTAQFSLSTTPPSERLYKLIYKKEQRPRTYRKKEIEDKGRCGVLVLGFKDRQEACDVLYKILEAKTDNEKMARIKMIVLRCVGMEIYEKLTKETDPTKRHKHLPQTLWGKFDEKSAYARIAIEQKERVDDAQINYCANPEIVQAYIENFLATNGWASHALLSALAAATGKHLIFYRDVWKQPGVIEYMSEFSAQDEKQEASPENTIVIYCTHLDAHGQPTHYDRFEPVNEPLPAVALADANKAQLIKTTKSTDLNSVKKEVLSETACDRYRRVIFGVADSIGRYLEDESDSGEVGDIIIVCKNELGKDFSNVSNSVFPASLWAKALTVKEELSFSRTGMVDDAIENIRVVMEAKRLSSHAIAELNCALLILHYSQNIKKLNPELENVWNFVRSEQCTPEQHERREIKEVLTDLARRFAVNASSSCHYDEDDDLKKALAESAELHKKEEKLRGEKRKENEKLADDQSPNKRLKTTSVVPPSRLRFGSKTTLSPVTEEDNEEETDPELAAALLLSMSGNPTPSAANNNRM